MLSPATPFPQVGSYALLATGDRVELARILGLPADPAQGAVRISLPFHEGASGTRVVELHELTDGTGLSESESRELADLGRELRGERVRGRKAKQERYDGLRMRDVNAPLLAIKLRQLCERQAKRAA